MPDIEELLSLILTSFVASRDFNGISAWALARKIKVPWGEIRPTISELIVHRKIDAAFESHCVNPSIKRLVDLPIQKQVSKLATEDESGICLYPSRQLIEERIDLSRWDALPYSRRLALAQAQLTPVFFELNVLERYFRDPRYWCYFLDRGGHISVRDEHYSSDQMAERDKVLLQSFGIGYDSDRNRVVVVFLRYLSDLSAEHQQMWRTHELTRECSMNSDYERSSIHGLWPEHYSVYEAFIQEQIEINKLSELMEKPRLFRNTFGEHRRPLEFSPMLRPTRRNFQEFALTLDKMLSENIERDFFRGDIPLEDRLVSRTGDVEIRQLGTLTLLERWLSARYRTRDGEDVATEVVRPFRAVRKARQPTAHSLTQDSFDQQLPSDQDSLLGEVVQSLQKLRLIFSSHPKAVGYRPAEWLDQGKIVFY